jgi:hypothetical protein
MKITISYVHAGVAGEVTTLPADFIKWERHTKQKFSDLWQQDGKDVSLRIGLEDLAILVWAVLARTGLNVPFEIWLDSLDSIDDFSEAETNPTQPEASTDSE